MFLPPFYFLFRHSSVALVCRGIRSCCSSALLLLSLVSVCLFGCLFLYLYIRACVCRHLTVISLFELSAFWQPAAIFPFIPMQLHFNQVSHSLLWYLLCVSLLYPSTSLSISPLSRLSFFIQPHVSPSLPLSLSLMFCLHTKTSFIMAICLCKADKSIPGDFQCLELRRIWCCRYHSVTLIRSLLSLEMKIAPYFFFRLSVLHFSFSVVTAAVP